MDLELFILYKNTKFYYMADSSTNIDEKLDKLIDSINHLSVFFSRRGREDRENHFYNYYGGNNSNKEQQFLRNLNSFNDTDFINLMNEELKKQKKIIDNLEKQLEDQTLSDDERRELEDKLYDVTSQKLELETGNLKDLKKHFKRLRDIEEEKLKTEWDNLSQAKKNQYEDNFDNFKNFRIGQADFEGKTANRNKASRMIAESGLGDTSVGRYGQTLISRQQRLNEIGHFGDILQTDGAEEIAQAIGGGRLTTSALKGFGRALSSTTKIFGPFALGIQLGLDAVKTFAQVVGAANAYITRLVNMQTDLNEMSFQKEMDINALTNERQIEAVKYMGDLAVRQLDIQGKNLTQAIDIATKQFVKSTEIAVGPLTKGINETAYDAANAFLDYQKDLEKFNIERTQRGSELERFQAKRDIDYKNFLALKEKEEANILTKFDANSVLKTWEGVLGAHTDVKGRISEWALRREESEAEKQTMQNMNLPTGTKSSNVSDVYRQNKKIFDILSTIDVNWMDKTYGMGQTELAMAVAKQLVQPAMFTTEWEKQQQQLKSSYESTVAGIQEQIGNKEIEIATEVATKYIEASAEVKKIWLQLAQKTEQWLDKFDEVTNNLGISLGYTNRKQLDSFQDSMFEASKVAAKFGKSFEEVTKIQQGFIESTGRNRLFGEHDYGQMLGLGKYLGDDGLAASYASEMEIFNAGVADSVDMLDEVLQDVNKIGLNGRKYTKTLVDNLKLAQKYNFKGGTKGLMEMAKWAENTRFNMNSMSAQLDKISEGGLEGVITQGAQFQVLGGHAAMNADPIAMMFERYADPQALMKRYQDMTIGYGSVDRNTGETTFSGTEQMLMEQIAKIRGLSLEDVMNETRARNKREIVAKQLKRGFDEDQLSFISNNATYNKETGQFQVKVKDGNKYKDVDVSQLTEDDLAHLMPEEHNERMEDYMATVISYLEKMTGEENLQKTMLGEQLNEPRRESYLIRLDKAHQNFVENFETYVTNAKDGMELANQKFSDYINMWKNNADAQGPGLDKINAATSNIVNALGETATVIAEANKKIKEIISNSGNQVTGQSDVGDNAAITMTPPRQNLVNYIKEGFVNADRMIQEAKQKQKGWSNFESDGWGIRPTTPIKDAVIAADNNKIVVPSENDEIIAGMPGGPITGQLQEMNNKINNIENFVHSGNSNSVNINMNGTLQLSSNGTSINIIEYLQNDPISLRMLSRMIVKHMSDAYNGGRGTLPIGVANT